MNKQIFHEEANLFLFYLYTGSSSFCLVCGHGGHALHMMEWFKRESVCPTGCGCMCPQQAKQICDETTIAAR